MNAFAQALFSFFKRPATMSDQAVHIFNPTASLDPSLLVHLLESWAKEDPNPMSILCDLRVTTIMHNKIPRSPEHEYLVLQTEDRENTTRFFLLERTVDPGLGTVPGEGRATALESVKQLCATITTNSSDLASLEEGLPKFDRLTVSSVQAAKIISDSLDHKGRYPAVDRFLGAGYVYAPAWHGQNVRFLQPNRPLSLYQLAIIAKAVHKRFSTYEVLSDQCYFQAGVIYSAVLYHFGSLCPENPQEGSDIILSSGLKYGRYRGLKIKAIDHTDVLKVIEDYKAEYAKAMGEVSV